MSFFKTMVKEWQIILQQFSQDLDRKDFLRIFFFRWLLYFTDLLNQIRGRYQYRAKLEGQANQGPPCHVVPPQFYKRPDPLIYDQYYLMAQHIAVTWDNPDIQLRLGEDHVSSAVLEPDTDYEIIARIWNGSPDAPAVGLPVHFSYLNFGIGTSHTDIGQTTIDLPVNGAPGHPAFASMPWHTPASAGHYCIQIELVWPDDGNPNNNLGQKNVSIRRLNSPQARFTFSLVNNASRTRNLHLEADAYHIPSPLLCDLLQPVISPQMTESEITAHRRDAASRHNRSNFPVPSGWKVTFDPREMQLGPSDQQLISVDITAPGDDYLGRQTFNIDAFDGTTLIGGVTLEVEG